MSEEMEEFYKQKKKQKQKQKRVDFSICQLLAAEIIPIMLIHHALKVLQSFSVLSSSTVFFSFLKEEKGVPVNDL